MSKRTAKRQSFAARQKQHRATLRIIKAHRGKPGFIGAVTSLRIKPKGGGEEVILGKGALFWGRR